MTEFDLPAWLSSLTGEDIVRFVRDLARWLTGAGTPGWVSLGLVVAFFVLWLWYEVVTRRFVGAVRSVQKIIRIQGDSKLTQDRLVDVDQALEKSRAHGAVSRRLVDAWKEFKETSIVPPAETGVLRNTVRPVVFFNREDLGLEVGMWRQVPSLFVSIGLLLTFLGLVAALQQTGAVLGSGSDDVTNTIDGLKTLLNVASAKFIMSLTGLACSILFTIILRFYAKRKDRALHMLCADIERGCDFISEQDMLREMLSQAKEQTAHLQAFSTELVAQVATPLKDDLPKAIRESIGLAMRPLVESISRETNEGIETLVGSVSEQLVEGVEVSVRDMKGLLEGVSVRLDEAAGRLDRSSEAMTGNVDNAVKVLVERVERLSAGIDESTLRLSAFAESMERSAATVTSMSDQVRQATESLTEATGSIRASIADVQASAQSMRETSEHTEAILRQTGEVIEASHATVQDGLRSLEHSVTEFKDVIDRYREIDEQLGDAFDKIETDVRASINEIGSFLQKVNEEFGHALNRLQAVIAQTEPFTPVSED